MITYEMIIDAQNTLVEHWEADGEKIIEVAATISPFNNTFLHFLDHCEACGGNWGGMLLTGIRKLYPEVWDVIPEDMGIYAFTDICNTLILCGVDTTA